ncbi:hypothetical protein GCM10023262_07070 [Bartonella pachyuromydis]|uniref:Uncharacterized protein n=1 Tax=Bartonella pachyuromydis TaxID=931097 RepID=A0ABP8VGG4_9HYPH
MRQYVFFIMKNKIPPLLMNLLYSPMIPAKLQRHKIIFYSTVTDFAKLRGWSTSVPNKTAV